MHSPPSEVPPLLAPSLSKVADTPFRPLPPVQPAVSRVPSPNTLSHELTISPRPDHDLEPLLPSPFHPSHPATSIKAQAACESDDVSLGDQPVSVADFEDFAVELHERLDVLEKLLMAVSASLGSGARRGAFGGLLSV